MVNLTKYTGLRRQGSKTLKFGNICNDYDFPTEREARGFERLYNSLAVDALEQIISSIKQGRDHINANVHNLKSEELVSHANWYFIHAGFGSLSLDSVLKETKRLYELSKNIKLLKKVELI